MNTQQMVRRKNLTVRREHEFNLQQNVKDMSIPQYDALKDPYLEGFFNHQFYKKHFRKTGIIAKKKSLSLKKYQVPYELDHKLQDSHPNSSHSHTKRMKKNEKGKFALPLIENKEGTVPGKVTSHSARVTKMYKSENKSHEL